MSDISLPEDRCEKCDCKTLQLLFNDACSDATISETDHPSYCWKCAAEEGKEPKCSACNHCLDKDD
jgi:hypothetical protein